MTADADSQASTSSPLQGLRPVRIERPEPPSSEVAKALLEYILSGRIGRGEKLPSERQLSEAFGVGRSVVREGIKSLGLLGLVEFRHGSGTYLSGPDSDLFPRAIEWGLLIGEQQTAHLVEARQHLEIITAAQAAERRTPEQMQELDEIFARLIAARDVDEFVARDVELHLSIARASGNSVLSNMLSSISSLLFVWIDNVIRAEHARVFAQSVDAQWPTDRAIREHRAILEAIRGQDVAAAHDAMSSHMQAAAGRLISALEARGDAQSISKLREQQRSNSASSE